MYLPSAARLQRVKSHNTTQLTTLCEKREQLGTKDFLF